MLALLATGAVSGVFAGLLGVSGGAIIVPVLAFAMEVLGLPADHIQHVAVASSLAIIIPTCISSARAHFARNSVDMARLRLWLPFAVLGTLAGGLMAGFFSAQAMRISFAVVAFTVSASILTDALQKLIGHLSGTAGVHRAFAMLIGFFSSLMGVGGGALSVPVQVALGQTVHRAVGTGAAIGVAIALAGTTGYIISGWGVAGVPPLSLGYVNLPAVVLVGGVAVLTAPLGAALAHRLEARTLKRCLALFLVLMGLNMLWKAFTG